MLQALFENSFDCIKVLDLDGRLVSINRRGCVLLEIDDPQDFIGRSWIDLWGMDSGVAREAVRRAAAGEQTRFEGFGATVKGTPRWWETAISPVAGADGRPEKLLAVSRDVTERVEREREAREAQGRASRTKDEFIATLAHELRNPLAAVVHAIATLDRIGTQSQEARHARAIIRRQTEHLAALLDDLLDIARIGEGKVALEKQPVDLRTIADRAVEAEMPRARAKGQTVRVELPTEPVIVAGDPARLRQVIANLVNNASKYTPAAGTIVVSARKEGQEAVLQVSDDGIGIAPDLVARVFDLFVQAQSGGSSQSGLGIGLALVKRMVELHGGSVSCMSEGAGRGTCMTVRMPLGHGVATAEPPRAETAPEVDLLHLLVVEDGDDAREMLVLTLRVMGHEVKGVSTAAEALAAAKSDVHDAIIADIGLPDMDGRALARALRESIGHDVVLLALSGYGQEEDRRSSIAAGFDCHLVKPVEPTALMRAIETALARRAAAVTA
jgi:PAS domain S-box-containing protein